MTMHGGARRAHPRSRGENEAMAESMRGTRGSSPLTRGKRRPRRRRRGCGGLIPAHAGKTRLSNSSSCQGRAHPRSRGENMKKADAEALKQGSSPLTRGKRPPPGGRRRAGRLIPANAGKTRPSKMPVIRPWAHPRSRGENERDTVALDWVSGSSPLTRGKQLRVVGDANDDGLIPAHAGKTGHLVGTSRQQWAHPRSRGENAQRPCDVRPAEGSSPLTRGKPLRGLLGAGSQGLIPAHAGKTIPSRVSNSSRRAHPRSRGENFRDHNDSGNPRGSSPLTRGKRFRVGAAHPGQGLIPAHAGKTWREILRLGRRRAHPRSRGENRWDRVAASRLAGSSPLTRGKRRVRGRGSRRSGLIPAHAGKTPFRRSRTGQTRAHPRSRGENSIWPILTRKCVGSSPLTRGKRRARRSCSARRRLIPAHAGKTR